MKNKFVSVGTQVNNKMIPEKPPEEKKITLTRTTTTFRPSKLLCKRMNIIDPYDGMFFFSSFIWLGILPDYSMTTTSLLKTGFIDTSFRAVAESTDTRSNNNTNPSASYFAPPPPPEVIDPIEDLKQPDIDLFATVFG